MEEVKPKRPPGRPPKSPEDRKGSNLTIRLRGGAREMLEASAESSGRSLSEEIEYRVERSFELNALMDSMINEAVWSVMETIKANKGKPVDLEFAIALIESIARSERETRGINGHLLRTNLVPFITGVYRATPEPGYRESNVDDEAERGASQDKAPTPVAAPEEQAAWEPLTAPTPNPDE
jgi:hypothetical protein